MKNNMIFLYAVGSTITFLMQGHVDKDRVVNLLKGDLHRIHHVYEGKTYQPHEVKAIQQENGDFQKDLNDLYDTIHLKKDTQIKLRALCIRWKLDFIDIDHL